MQEIVPWLAVALSAAAFLYGVLFNNHKASKGAIAQCMARVDLVEDRVSRVEERLKYVPNTQTIHDLALLIATLQSDIRALAQRVGQLAEATDRNKRTQ